MDESPLSPESNRGYKWEVNMDKIKISSKLDAYGTSFHGTIATVNPRTFAQFMGDDYLSDDYKISRMWICKFKGKVYTVYDWKSTDLYANGLPCVQDFWSVDRGEHLHIGSKSSALEESEFVDHLLLAYKHFTSINKIVGE
jgi:hypothetical protein